MGRLRVIGVRRRDRPRAPLLGVGFATALASACGSRTTFNVYEGPPPPPECVADKDCDFNGDLCYPVACVAGKCTDLTPIDCDDKNPCTTDRCEPDTGQCSHPSAVLDLDGDGHFAPLPGKRPGDVDACGDDCDDTNAAAHPGGVEVCDGVDNDCDGIVDNNTMLSAGGDAVLVSDGATQAAPGSLAFGSRGYLASYSGEIANTSAVYLPTLDRTGGHLPPARFTVGPADAYGGPLAWTGDRFGLAWSDRRDARSNTPNYEIYFNLVNPDGTKRNADLRLTHADGFSISPSLAWTGNEFIVAWQDDGQNNFGTNQIFGQRIDVDGNAIGGNIPLDTERGPGQTSPAVAAGQRTIGIVWMRGNATNHDLVFAVFDSQLHIMGTPTMVTGAMAMGVYPTIVYNQSKYIIAWHDPDSPVKTVYGSVRDELGAELVPQKALTQTPQHARYPALLPFGDRALLIWSDDRDQNGGYELYGKTLNEKLDTLVPEKRLTNAPGDSVDSTLSFGPNGEVGILFGDNRSGSQQVYFTHLDCVTGPKPQ